MYLSLPRWHNYGDQIIFTHTFDRWLFGQLGRVIHNFRVFLTRANKRDWDAVRLQGDWGADSSDSIWKGK